MRLLFLGDIVGVPGLAAVTSLLPALRVAECLDLVVANAENVQGGSGLMPRDYRKLRAADVDAITMGDHIYKKMELAEVLNNPLEPIVKPANFPSEAPGRDHCKIVVQGRDIVVISLMGRTYMRPVDCPFHAVDRVLAGIDAKIIVVDVHAEATADKYQLGRYLDGRVTAVLGTHTHVTTADEQIFPNGTAFQCDVGMTGPHDGIIGRRTDRILHTMKTFEPSMFEVATNDVRLVGTIVDFDPNTGKATEIRRFVKSI